MLKTTSQKKCVQNAMSFFTVYKVSNVHNWSFASCVHCKQKQNDSLFKFRLVCCQQHQCSLLWTVCWMLAMRFDSRNLFWNVHCHSSTMNKYIGSANYFLWWMIQSLVSTGLRRMSSEPNKRNGLSGMGPTKPSSESSNAVETAGKNRLRSLAFFIERIPLWHLPE